SPEREHYVLIPDCAPIGESAAPRLLNRPHSISADVEITDGEEGVIVAQGGSSGGYSLFVKDHRLHYAYNYLGSEEFLVSSNDELPKGRVNLRFEFEPTGKPKLEQGLGAPGL